MSRPFLSDPLTVRARSRLETQALGERLARVICPGQLLALRGELGAGKTTFVQGLARGLGIVERVTSPTFVLVNEYRAPNGTRLVHVDTYRLGNDVDAAEREAATLGLDEIFESADAIVAVEWAERVAGLLPADHLLVEIDHEACIGDEDGQRTVRITALGSASAAAIKALA